MRAIATCLAVILPLLGCTRTTASAPATDAGKAAGTPQKICLLCPEPPRANCTLCATSNPVLNVSKDGAASSLVRLCNRGGQDVTLDLRLSDFHAPGGDGATYPLYSQGTISSVPPNNAVVAGTAPLVPNACVDIKVDVSGLWQAGFYSAELRNGDTGIASLKALRYQVPFNVKADGPTPEAVTVDITRGRAAHIRLRNDDDMAYRFTWTLDVGNEQYSGTSDIRARGTKSLQFEPRSDAFKLHESGFLRSGERSGTLTLAFEPDASVRDLPVPQRRYPVTARLSYFNPDWQRFVNWAAVFALLLVGIIVSFFVGHVLPTQKKRVDIKQRLADLDGRLAGLSEVIDTRILNLLRLEKKRLRGELREQLPIFPQSAVELPKLDARIDWLEKRIDLTARAGDLLETIDTADDTLAIPEADEIRRHCRDIAEVIRKPLPAEGDFTDAEDHMRKAEAIAEASDTDPEQDAVDELSERAARVRAAIPGTIVEGSGWKICEDALQSLMNIPSMPSKLSRVQYVRLARRVCQAELLVRFAELVDASADACMRKRRLDRADDLFKALKDGPDQSHERARDIVHQIEQNVSRADLVAEMSRMKEELDKAGDKTEPPLNSALRVEIDPLTPITYQLVTFRVRFQRPGLDSAVAQDEIPCTWYVNNLKVGDREFSPERCGHGPDGHHARGWLTGHYFVDDSFKWHEVPARALRRMGAAVGWVDREVSETGGKFNVSVHFPDTGLTLSRSVTLERTKDYVESRSVLALASLGITLFIVAFGLLAGAQEKLQSLDWLSGMLAVLVLGFGADTLKTLISRT
jgi:hypothetical protein